MCPPSPGRATKKTGTAHRGAITYTFAYGPDRSRYKKVHSGETTYYIGSGFEQINKALSTEYRHIIRANGRAIMLRKDYSLGGVGHEYIHRDHLGSVTALTSEDGAVIERYSYDAWGCDEILPPGYLLQLPLMNSEGILGTSTWMILGSFTREWADLRTQTRKDAVPDPVTQARRMGKTTTGIRMPTTTH